MRLKPSRLFLVFVLGWIAFSVLIFSRLDDRIAFQHREPKEFIHEDYVFDSNLHNIEILEQVEDKNRTRKPPVVFQDLAKDKPPTPPKNGDRNLVDEVHNKAVNGNQPIIKDNIIGDIPGNIPQNPVKVEMAADNMMKQQENKSVDGKQANYSHILPVAIYDVQPPEAPGEGGRGVNINETALDPEEREKFAKMMKLNAFNEYASNFISVRRSLRDTRNPSCPRTFREDLPSTSVIICFHNEAWTVLLRTVHSVLDRSPEHLVKEVILIDDYSDMDHLKEPLQYYMSTLEKVRILRTKQREGLIRARLLGVDNARAPVLTFLDSHVECFPGWLEPLLTRVKEDRRRIVAPIINMISAHNFQVGGGDSLAVGMFKLTDLAFNWMQLPQRDRIERHTEEPFRTPAIAGGLFSIDRDYFIEMGKYDEGMEIWGFENIEISLRIWMCGGSLEIHPCSHVAHIFRSVSPYSWGRPIGDILHKNAVRLAEVWLDDYKHYFYERLTYDLGDYGNVTDRIALRKKLKCHSFQWYIDNVYPDITIPPKTLFLGEIRQPDPKLPSKRRCLDAMSQYANGNLIALVPCHHMRGNQMWQYSEQRQFRIQDGCLTYSQRKEKVVFLHCSANSQFQNWTKQMDGRIVHIKTNLCLQRHTDSTLVLAECSNSDSQIWEFESQLHANVRN